MLLLGTDIRDYWLKHGKLPEDPTVFPTWFKSRYSDSFPKYRERENDFRLRIYSWGSENDWLTLPSDPFSGLLQKQKSFSFPL